MLFVHPLVEIGFGSYPRVTSEGLRLSIFAYLNLVWTKLLKTKKKRNLMFAVVVEEVGTVAGHDSESEVVEEAVIEALLKGVLEGQLPEEGVEQVVADIVVIEILVRTIVGVEEEVGIKVQGPEESEFWFNQKIGTTLFEYSSQIGSINYGP
jgi:hypothetical protein